MIVGNPIKNLFSGNMQWLENKQSTILSAASIISAATIVSALSGIIIKRILLHKFSDTIQAQEALEAFWIAFQVPDLLFQLIVVGAFSAAFIPIFTRVRNKNEATAFKMSSILLNIVLMAFVFLGCIVFVFAREITEFRTGAQITTEQIDIIVNLTRLMLFAQFFFAVSNFFTGILQSYHRFIIPALASILYNIGILIGVYFFSESMGIYAAGAGVLIGAFLHMLIQIPLILKMGFRYQPALNFKFDGVSDFFTLIPPRMLSIGAYEFRKLLLGFFTTSIGNLSFLVMYLAVNLMVIPIRFFGTPIGQAALPFLSEESDRHELKRYKSLVVQSLNQIAFLTLPASVLLLLLRVPVVRLVYGVDNFTWPSTILTSQLVGIIAISITVQALVQLLIRAFYALRDTRTPLLITVLDFVFYLVLGAFFVFYLNWGVIGIAVATTLTAFFEFGLFIYFLHRKVVDLFDREFWIPQLKIVTASFIMAVLTYLPFKIFDELVFNTSRTIELIGLTVSTATIGMLVYVYIGALLEIKELQLIRSIFQRFNTTGKNLSKTPEVVVENSGEDSNV
ncbi:MAG: murein biosynthesis integral membrane protein MurJ [Patescibacteria group bacterium]